MYMIQICVHTLASLDQEMDALSASQSVKANLNLAVHHMMH